MINDFSGINLRHSYDSGAEDILWNFYIPVLSKANRYDRIAGFFSSTSLALSARGMEEFLNNGGKMRLVTCPRLSADDAKILEKSVNKLDEILSDSFIEDYSGIADAFQADHVKALGWMLAQKRLEIKIAVIKSNDHILSEEEIIKKGIMHQKVGILYDQSGNVLTFSGSNNESASGWMGNTEEFKVFCSWEDSVGYFKDDMKKFDSFWYGTRADVEMKSLPKAIEEHLIEVSYDFKPDHINIMKYYYHNPKFRSARTPKILRPFFYQESAVDMWEKNNRSLLLQMATGCGKTKTAISCMTRASVDTDRLLVVIATPQATLSGQWKNDIEDLDELVIQGKNLAIPSKYSLEIQGGRNWRTQFQKEIRKLTTGYYPYLIVYVTHALAHTEDFLSIVKDSGPRVTKFLIGDEVHGLGASETCNALDEVYTYRLGLSATPQRWFDDLGSERIEHYFGDKSFEFSIEDALREHNPITGKTFLVNYFYHPRFIQLTDDEMESYRKLTEKISKMSSYGDDDFRNYLSMLRFQRANIEKNAQEKYLMLGKILDELGPDISDTIIFVSDDQIDRVMQMMNQRKIVSARFTMKQGTTPMTRYGGMSERDYIISQFKEKRYQVLVAIKCLDEGIDIPSADTAIVMASSTNPREYVQRIGRIIRQAPNKGNANIYDMIIEPDISRFDDDTSKAMEQRIFSKELDRVKDLSRNALNNVEVLNTVSGKEWEAAHK